MKLVNLPLEEESLVFIEKYMGYYLCSKDVFLLESIPHLLCVGCPEAFWLIDDLIDLYEPSSSVIDWDMTGV